MNESLKNYLQRSSLTAGDSCDRCAAGLAACFAVHAWLQDEPPLPPQAIILEMAPPATPRSLYFAWYYIGLLTAANQLPYASIVARAYSEKFPGDHGWLEGDWAYELGWDLAMEALGTGSSRWDEHTWHPTVVPTVTLSCGPGADGLIKSARSDAPTYADTQDPGTITLWLSRLPADASVHIDDDGMRLVHTGHDNTYLEIGGHTPEQMPLDVDTFVDRLNAEHAEPIDPELHFRLLCLAEDFPYRPASNDKPAFRMGCNDYADMMQKDHRWVTFDNGSSYYTAEDVKATLAGFGGDDDEYQLTSELKAIVEWWL